MAQIQRILTEEDGQGLVEYALIISLIALAAIAAITGLGVKMNNVFQGIKNSI